MHDSTTAVVGESDFELNGKRSVAGGGGGGGGGDGRQALAST